METLSLTIQILHYHHLKITQTRFMKLSMLKSQQCFLSKYLVMNEVSSTLQFFEAG